MTIYILQYIKECRKRERNLLLKITKFFYTLIFQFNTTSTILYFYISTYFEWSAVSIVSKVKVIQSLVVFRHSRMVYLKLVAVLVLIKNRWRRRKKRTFLIFYIYKTLESKLKFYRISYRKFNIRYTFIDRNWRNINNLVRKIVRIKLINDYNAREYARNLFYH